MADNQSYILMIADDEDDRYITEVTFSEMGFKIPVKFFSHKQDFIKEILSSKPSLILVNYNPNFGSDIISRIKTNPDLSYIPLVVLSEIASGNQTKRFYQAGVNTIIQKPATGELTRNKISIFLKYWFEVAELA